MEKLLDFIRGLIAGQSHVVSQETLLVESGIVDSLNIVKLMSFIEQETGRPVLLENLDLEDIKTPLSIVKTYYGKERV